MTLPSGLAVCCRLESKLYFTRQLCNTYTAVQSQNAVAAYFPSKQLLPFGFADHSPRCTIGGELHCLDLTLCWAVLIWTPSVSVSRWAVSTKECHTTIQMQLQNCDPELQMLMLHQLIDGFTLLFDLMSDSIQWLYQFIGGFTVVWLNEWCYTVALSVDWCFYNCLTYWVMLLQWLCQLIDVFALLYDLLSDAIQ